MKRTVLSVLVLSMLSPCLYSQVTLSASDVDLELGSIINYENGIWDGVMADGGANQTWDMTNSLFGPVANDATIEEASDTPLGSDFPGATVAQVFGSFEQYQLYDMQNGLFDYFGFVSGGIPVFYSDSEEFFNFPMNYMDTHSDDFGGTFTSGVDWVRSGSVSSTIDGWGTLITPAGTYPNVLRVQYNEEYSDVSDIQTNTYSTTIYHFWKEGIQGPLATYFVLVQNGFEVYSGNYQTTPVSVDEMVTMEVNVYPNPTTDYFTVNATGIQHLELLDLNGRLVRQFPQNQTQYYVGDLPSGSYFIRAKSDVGVLRSSLIVR